MFEAGDEELGDGETLGLTGGELTTLLWEDEVRVEKPWALLGEYEVRRWPSWQVTDSTEGATTLETGPQRVELLILDWGGR